MKRLLIAFLLTQFTFLISPASDTIRILCIGNSFSWDAVEQARATARCYANLFAGTLNAVALGRGDALYWRDLKMKALATLWGNTQWRCSNELG